MQFSMYPKALCTFLLYRMRRLQKLITYGGTLTGVCLLVAAAISYSKKDEKKPQSYEINGHTNE